MALVAAVQGLGLLSIMLVLFSREMHKPLMHAMYLPLSISCFLFLPTSANQYYIVRVVLYATLLASICVTVLWSTGRNRVVKTAIIAVIVVGLVLIPVTRYASLPYLHLTTQELGAATFVHYYYLGNQRIYYTEYPPYIRIIVGKDPGWELTGYSLISNQDFNPNANNFLITKRHLTRDGYYSYPKPISVTFNNMTKILSQSHNIAYVNGYTVLFVKE